MTARVVANKFKLTSKEVTVYASPKISSALSDLLKSQTLYDGVKTIQLLQALYDQGKKDGARVAFETIQDKVGEAENLIPHRNPGKPKKRKK